MDYAVPGPEPELIARPAMRNRPTLEWPLQDSMVSVIISREKQWRMKTDYGLQALFHHLLHCMLVRTR